MPLVKYKIESGVDVGNDILFGNVQGNITGNLLGDVTGNVTGDIYGDLYNDAKTTKIVDNSSGLITGTISSLSNLSTSSLAEGTNQYFTQSRARQSLSQGTGVTYDNTTGVISIGQAVGTTSNVTFNDVVVSGNLTVQGDTTTLNTSTLSVEDLNITVAKGAANASAANGAGLTVDGASATLTYVSASDSWSANKLLSAVGLTSTGTTSLQQITEVINTKTGATGTVTHDYSTGDIFYHTGISANFTANLTNVPTTNNRAISVALVLSQGATAYIPNALQIDGNAVSINWPGGSAPTGSANKLDFVTFTLLRVSSTWTAVGQLSSFG